MPLTDRQMQTARLVRLGYTNKQIAEIQRVQVGTVKCRLEDMYIKIETTSKNPRVELATWYVRENR